MNFAALVRNARRRAGMTQADLAVVVGVGSRAVWLIENGGGTLQSLIPILDHLRIALAGLPPGRSLGARLTAARQKNGWSLQELGTHPVRTAA
jgi:transcriptional regulator with XRE-family HTH domain